VIESGSFTGDLTLRRGKSRLLLPPLGAASTGSDGTRPNEPTTATTTNAEKSSRDDTSSSPSSLEISPPAALADAASSSFLDLVEPLR